MPMLIQSMFEKLLYVYDTEIMFKANLLNYRPCHQNIQITAQSEVMVIVDGEV